MESRREKFTYKASSFASTQVHLAVLGEEMSHVDHKTETMTGNTAAAYIGYALSDVSTLFPITPSSAMGASVDAWAVSGRKNCFGQVLQVQQMQSEAGAAGALHGIASAGSLGTTFTSSQGLLLMVPDMLRIAGSLYPSVIHVASRAISGEGWNINADHSDVMAVRHTGWGMLSSCSVQDIHDYGIVAHLAAIRGKIPFVHFFEGFQLSHEVSKIQVLEYEQIAKLIPMEKIYEHRRVALSPNHPSIRGTVQPFDYMMQAIEANNPFYAAVPDIVEEAMQTVSAMTGRPMSLFQYTGHEDAERIIVIMGASAEIAAETVNYLNEHDPEAKVGVIAVRLFRPFSLKHFMNCVPLTCRKMAVLDRTIEPGALAEPLFLDIVMALAEGGRRDIDVVGGRYGLGGKYFGPMDVKSVFDNLALARPKNHFIVNVIDDLLHANLPIPKPEEWFSTLPKGTSEAVFWGIGGDGTVSANIEAIQIIGGNTELFAQGQFEYDSHKSGGVTKSFLRFGESPLTCHYPIVSATYLACHHHSFVFKFDVLQKLAQNGVFVFNTKHTTLEELNKFIPGSLKRGIAEKNAKFYVIDALELAKEVGLGNKTSMIMQTIFFALSGVLPFERLVPLLKASIQKAYGKKGQHIVDMNNNAVDKTMDYLVEIKYSKKEWLKEEVEKKYVLKFGDVVADFVGDVMEPVAAMNGDTLPTSAMEPGGMYPLTATSKYEKRGIAANCPSWSSDKCTQCNYCSLMCPHSCIRPFLVTPEEVEGEGHDMATLKAKGAPGYEYRIQVSPYDCTGCEVCVNVCPDNALKMIPFEDSAKSEGPRWDYIEALPNRGHLFDKETVKGSQFQQPLLEFPGACEGCGETQYVKLMTQLYGDRMVMACAAGCNVVWAGSFPTVAYSVNEKGRGPSYGFSLFEDTAEYGYGMALANRQARGRAVDRIERLLDSDVPSDELKKVMKIWLAARGDPTKMRKHADEMIPLLEAEKDKDELLLDLFELRDVLSFISHWVIGGDGWAYDIGFGGLDHVVSSGENINIIILDNEVYSNTGGQKSKATPMGAVAKFAAKGKLTHKKDIGAMLMSKGDVYVASVAVGANYQQTLKALIEAEAYDGPSVVIAYSPCIEHGIVGGLHNLQEQTKLAVESGYWNLYRYNPALREKGENPFQLDSPRLREDLTKFLKSENRFRRVGAMDQALSERYASALVERTREKFDSLKLMAQGPSKVGETETPDMTILYISETGNAESVAKRLGSEAGRRGVSVRVTEADDMDIADLPKQKTVIVVASTCGQGETPDNGKSFIKDLTASDVKLSGVRYAVFGLGDSSYVFFNKVGTAVDTLLASHGAERITECGMGDDEHEDRYETALEEWEPELWMQLGVKEPINVAPPVAENTLELVSGVDDEAPYAPEGFTSLRLVRNELLTPPDHDRDIRHYEFSLEGTDMQYALGDSLAVLPRNDEERVLEFLQTYGLDPKQMIKITPRGDARFPELISVKKLFTQVLDIFGRPSRRFIKALLFHAKDDDKTELEKLLSAEYKDRVVDKLLNFADILLMFTSVRPPLDLLIDLIPLIKPRYYSIASSFRADASRVELCIVLVEWNGGVNGEARTGLCTGFLRQLKANDVVACTVRPATIVVPRDDTVPIIMAGLGTGMAPYRALVQDREYLKAQGSPAGPLTLYYGCRYEKKEFLYAGYLRKMADIGVVRLRPAFSRDQKHKIYVTDKIKEDAEHVHKQMVKENGVFLYCGPAGRQPDDVRKAVVWGLTQNGIEQSDADNLMTEWRLSARYGEETW